MLDWTADRLLDLAVANGNLDGDFHPVTRSNDRHPIWCAADEAADYLRKRRIPCDGGDLNGRLAISAFCDSMTDAGLAGVMSSQSRSVSGSSLKVLS